MKRFVPALLFLFLLTTPCAFAQKHKRIGVTVVGEDNPVDAGHYCAQIPPGSGTFDRDLTDCYLAQAFSLGAAALVNRIDVTLIGIGAQQTAQTFPLTIVLTQQLVPVPPNEGSYLPPVFLSQTQCVAVPPSQADEFIPFSISFPAMFLPKGNYYLVLYSFDANNVPPNCPQFPAVVTWAPNQTGSFEVGNVGPSYCQAIVSIQCGPTLPSFGWQPISTDPTQATNLSGTSGTFAFELDGPFSMPPVGGGRLQIARLLVQGPVVPPPGGPIEAQLGFLDMNGNPIGPTSTVSPGPGQLQWLNLDLSPFVTQFGQRIEVQPIITESPDSAGEPTAPARFSANMQILDALSGFETVLAPSLQPGSFAPSLLPQVLAGGQTMRITVSATDSVPCNATLSFADKDGNPLGSSLPVAVNSDATTWSDLNADSLGLTFGRRIEVLPIVTPTAIVGAAPVPSVCAVSVEVFDHLAGRTETSQSTLVGLPAVP